MFWLLAIPLLFGYLAARRMVGEGSRLGALSLGLGLAIALTLLGVNGVYRVSNLQLAVNLTLGVQLLGIVALSRLPRPESTTWRPSWVSWLSLAIIYFFTASQQIANPDDDYWIHTPLQGLMLHDNFPPFNPFFSEIPMNGHYGRNLSLVTVAYLSGLDTFFVQHLMTCLVQLLTYLILLRALDLATGSRMQALLGVSLIYFGINVGGRGGLMDTLQNNNAYVHLYLALTLRLSLAVWARPLSWGCAALAGAVLGGYAIVYETHFGLTVLAILATLPLVVWKGPRRQQLLASFIMLAVAAPIAATQGGPITNIVQRKLSGQKEVAAETLSKGMQNQSQVVKLTVPKKNLMQILLENGEYQRISCIYSCPTPLNFLYTPSPGRGYAYIWSGSVLKLHFLALYLAPWSAWFLLKRRHIAGWWLWCWGAISFLTPALVDFGPIYESEYFRWEFAAGVGLAGALGIALGQLWDETRQNQDWTYEVTPRGLLLDIRKGGWLQILILAIVYLDTLACSLFVQQRVASMAQVGWLRGGLILPATQDWLQRHTVLDFEPIDWRAARWLEKQVRPGDRLLTNFRQENNFSILFESTLTGVTGARCVGHALPLDEEAIGTTPYHQAAPAAAFWETLDRNYLDQLLVDWIYYRPTAARPKLDCAGLELAWAEDDGRQQRLVYRYQRRPLQLSPKSAPLPQGLRITRVEANGPLHLRGGSLSKLKLRLENPNGGDEASRLAVVPVQLRSGKSPNEVELAQIPLPAAGEVEVPLVAPFEEGEYRLEFLWRSAQGQATIPSPETHFFVDFATWLKDLKVVSFTAPVQGGPNQLVVADLQFQAASRESFRPRSVIGCLAAVVRRSDDAIPEAIHRGELHGDVYLLPGVNLQEVELGPDLRCQVAGVLPRQPGRYRLDLFLSPEQGKLYRYPGPNVEVRP